MRGVKQLADGLFQLRGFPPNAINVYLMGDVLVDAATRHAGSRILRQLARAPRSRARADACPPGPPGREQGGVREARDPALVRRARRRTRWRPATSGRPTTGSTGCSTRVWAGPPRKVDRALREGDEVAGFQVLDVPGHSPGHVAYWRESDRVLVLGDVLNNMNVLHRHSGPARAAGRSSRSTRPATASRRAGSRRSSRRSSASGTGRRCATRTSSASSLARLP